jgi:hydroxymethylglutaryl-CoA synthase
MAATSNMIKSAMRRGTATKQHQRRSLTSTPYTPPDNVGILGMDVYFPRRFVSQSDLEKFDGASAGKYTKGLEQTAMAYVDDTEDIYSMCLTAVETLLEKYNIDRRKVGRLEVGTETLLDKSKSIKTVLMQRFQDVNPEIEGIDTVNACFGGTAALMNAVQWIESSQWDGRYAIVVTGDIAVYEPGPARPTGGAGVVAMLIGPEAPIAFERRVRSTYMEHAYDFYKPNLSSEYPVVDGHLSIGCYLRALDSCYASYGDRFHAATGTPFSLDQVDYALFHSPFTKMVRKSFQRMYYLDYLKNPSDAKFAQFHAAAAGKQYEDRDVAKALAVATDALYDQKVGPSLLLPKLLGNTYTASLYTGLLSLIAQTTDEQIVNSRVQMFSYGSGLAAQQWSFQIRDSLQQIREQSNILDRLEQRIQSTPEQFTEALQLRERVHNLADYTPVSSTQDLFSGTFFLEQTDSLKRRTYLRK